MLPAQLTEKSFANYPPKGRAQAIASLPLLRQFPLGFVPFLLKEFITFDWKFPYEQFEFTSQMTYLNGLTSAQKVRELEEFAGLKLNDTLEKFDWVNQPAQFMEQLSAHLWATHQMDTFRSASEAYVRRFYETLPKEDLPLPRLGVALFGQNVSATQYQLFRKLRPHGVYFSRINPTNGFDAITQMLKGRSAKAPTPYAHWCIDGAQPSELPGYTCVSWAALSGPRGKLAAKMLQAYESSKFDPEKLRTDLAVTTPESVGMQSSGDPVLDRFQLSLFTEGSGTQVYSTTFVQWAAREALRRAHPLTIYTRFTPRQKERTMDELLSGQQKANVSVDAEGSLIDGDMAAFYTWINMQRLPGANDIRFLAWFEGHGEAVVLAPGLKAGSDDSTPLDMPALLAKLV